MTQFRQVWKHPQDSARVEAMERAMRDVLNSFDDGVRSCTGVMSNGDLVWKGSFISFMERMRDMLPPDNA